MSNNINNLGKIVSFNNNINHIKTNYQFLNFLKNKKNKTELEEKAYKGLKRTLVFSWPIAILFAIGICLGTFLFAHATSFEPGHHNTYMVETDVVKNGVFQYHYNEYTYDASSLDYKDGTWLYIYIDRETKEVVKIEDMIKANDEAAEKESYFITKSLTVYVISIVILIIFFIITRFWMKPFSKWKKTYLLNNN